MNFVHCAQKENVKEMLREGLKETEGSDEELYSIISRQDCNEHDN